MILEKYIDLGVLFEIVMRASKVTPITFDNGLLHVGNTTLGTRDLDYTSDMIETAIKKAFAEAK